MSNGVCEIQANLYFPMIGGPGDQATLSVLTRFLDDPDGPGVHPEIRDRFDIIGVDYRGTGLSQPINCSYELFNEYTRIPLYAPTEDSFSTLVGLNKAFRKSCLDLTGTALVDYMDTLSVVKDHEAVRRAIGNQNASFIGASGGTQLWTQYAEQFPNNIRAMVLDASFSLSQSVTSRFVEGAASNDATLRQFL